MTRCQNPECRKGLTPGLVQLSLGNTKAPLISNGVMAKPKMRWGWVNCPACNADANMRKQGIVYKHVQRSEEEMEQRRQLANDRADYKAPAASSFGRLGAIAQAQNGKGPIQATPNEQLSQVLAQNAKLLEQVTKLTEQITELLTENRALRKQLEPTPAVVTN